MISRPQSSLNTASTFFSKKNARRLGFFMAALPISIASTTEAAGEIATGLLEQSGQSALFYTSSILTSLTIFGLNMEYTYDGIGKIADLISGRTKNSLSLRTYLLLGACISYLLFSEFVKGDYFTEKLHDDFPTIQENTTAIAWRTVAITLGILNALNFLFIEGISMVETLAEKATETKGHSLFARTTGIILGAGGGLVEGISTFAVVATYLSANSIPAKMTLGLGSTLNAVANYAFRGRTVRGNLDDFFHHIKTNGIRAREVAPFIISAAISIYVVNAVRDLNKMLIGETLDDIGINESNHAIHTIARDILPWFEMFQDGIIYGGMYLEPANYVATHATSLIGLFGRTKTSAETKLRYYLDYQKAIVDDLENQRSMVKLV